MKIITRMNSRILTDSPFIGFLKFSTKIAIIGFPGIHPLVISVANFPQKWQFRPKNK